MEERRAVIVVALAVAALLGAVAVWRVGAGPSPRAAASIDPPPRPTREAPESGRDRGDRAPPASPSLPASAYEPIIDMPAGPPPEEGAGDDFAESGLPRALFDGKIRLERLSPSPARLSAMKAELGREVSEATRAELSASFLRHDEAAAAAIGYYRLREVSEEEAVAQIARARARYLGEAAAALGVPVEQAERLLAGAGGR
jgi:hypothetical protein